MDFTYKTLEKLGKSGHFDRKISPLVSSEDMTNKLVVSGNKAIFSKGSNDEVSGNECRKLETLYESVFEETSLLEYPGHTKYPVDSVMSMMPYNTEPQSRQRMRPWLESRINSREIAGLEWVDQSQLVFKVPWKHVGNREWKEDDSQIFKEWAVHTGRYTEGVDTPDWPTWKTRFRCALTKLPDIKELKDQNQLDGNVNEPYRVYQFLQRNKYLMERRLRLEDISKQSWWGDSPPNPTDDFSQDIASPQSIYDGDIHNQGPVVPTTVGDEISTGSADRLASDLERIHTDDLIKCPSTEIRNAADEMDTSSGGFDNAVQNMELSVSNIHQIANKPYPGEQMPIRLIIKPEIIFDAHIYITLKYRTQTILEKLITNTYGCRIFHGKQEQFIQDFKHEQDFTENLFGSQYAEPIQLPPCDTSNSQQKKLTDDLLNVTDRGIQFKMDAGNIIAIRKCRCTVFVSSPSLNNGQTTKLRRDEATVIFDFHQYFYPALEKYMYGHGPKPSTDVLVSFGQRFHEKDSASSLLISANLVHTYACQLLTTVTCSSPHSPPIEISKSDDYDKFLDQSRLVSLQRQTNVF